MATACTWAHRVPIKATAPVNFSQGRLAFGAGNSYAKEALRLLTIARGQMLSSFEMFNADDADVLKNTKEYLSLLQGVIQGLPLPDSSTPTQPRIPPPAYNSDHSQNPSVTSPEEQQSSPQLPASLSNRARSALLFKWSDILSGEVVSMQDAQYDLVSVLLELGLWYMSHAGSLAEGNSSDEALQKKIYNALRTAAGIFQHVNERERSSLQYTPMTDTDDRILICLYHQCLAEAQEVTIERARQKGNDPALIASLAHDTALRFRDALSSISSMDGKSTQGLSIYLNFKTEFYTAYGYCYTAVKAYKEEKAGEAIRLFKQSATSFAAAGKLGKDCKKSSKKAFVASLGCDPTQHPLFKTLGETITKSADKAERENGFIYHQKIPADDQAMVERRSLVKPIPFQMPRKNTEVYKNALFDLTSIPKKGESQAADKASSDDKPVDKTAASEPKRPQHETYCVIS